VCLSGPGPAFPRFTAISLSTSTAVLGRRRKHVLSSRPRLWSRAVIWLLSSPSLPAPPPRSGEPRTTWPSTKLSFSILCPTRRSWPIPNLQRAHRLPTAHPTSPSVPAPHTRLSPTLRLRIPWVPTRVPGDRQRMDPNRSTQCLLLLTRGTRLARRPPPR
jgi:hypothetical protein